MSTYKMIPMWKGHDMEQKNRYLNYSSHTTWLFAVIEKAGREIFLNGRLVFLLRGSTAKYFYKKKENIINNVYYIFRPNPPKDLNNLALTGDITCLKVINNSSV